MTNKEDTELPAVLKDTEDSIVTNSNLVDDALPLDLTEKDISDKLPTEVEKKLLLNEMAGCDLYLHNIHKSFKYAGSVSSVIALVKAGVGVQIHRRATLEKASGVSEKQKPAIQFDTMGNIISD